MRGTKAKRILAVLTIALSLSLCLVGCSSSDTGTTSSVHTGGIVMGTVVDADSLTPLDNVRVVIGTLTGVTDGSGRYNISGVTPGQQTIRVSRRDFDNGTQRVQVAGDQVVTQDIAMFASIQDWLVPGQSYNWQVEAVQANGTVTPGPVWQFSTVPQTASIAVEVVQAIDQGSATKVALSFLASKAQTASTIVSVEPILGTGGVTLAYAFILDPTGYVIVPASNADVLPPVLAYSFTSPFSTHLASSLTLVNMIRADISLRLAALKQEVPIAAAVIQDNQTRWANLLSGTGAPATVQAKYGPFLYAPTWHQRSPYNDKCPTDPSTGDTCIVGCVATAYAQVLNAWWCPTSLSLTGTYTTKTRQIKVNCADANFTNLDYKKGYPDDETKAKLSFACGVIARMNYTSTGSGANTFTLGKRISGKYGYAQTKEKRFAQGDTFDSQPIIDNLTLGASKARPVVMSIKEVDEDGEIEGGHAIVADGYDNGDGSFHLNMGWGNKSDGWYQLPNGMPSGYTYIAGYVYDIRPTTVTTTDTPTSQPLALAPENPFPRNGATEFPLDEVLTWSDCDNAVSYNCTIWKSSDPKPATPNYTGLGESVLDPNQ